MLSKAVLNNLISKDDISVVDAMRKIDANAEGVLFIVDEEERLSGCVTDGDIRRWLIRTGDLDTKIAFIMNKEPKCIDAAKQHQKRQYMSRWQVRAIPVVDGDRHIQDVLFGEKKARATGDEGLPLRGVPVVIMAGGSGTRLYPYTKILPKPLIPVGDIPISERIIRQFHSFGCREFHFIVNCKKNMVKAYFNEIEKDYELHYADEDTPLGTGGGLALLKGKVDGTFILSNCDILIREDFSKIYAAHKENGNVITMVCSLKAYSIPYGVVHLQSDGRLDNIEEKPQLSFLTNTGCYIAEPEVIENMPENTVIGFPDIIAEYQHKGKRVGIYPVGEDSWLDMGQMDTLEEMRERLEGAVEE